MGRSPVLDARELRSVGNASGTLGSFGDAAKNLFDYVANSSDGFALDGQPLSKKARKKQ